MKPTLRQDIHRVVDLNVHVITDGLKLLSFGRNDLAVSALDLVRRRAVFGEAARDHNASAVVLGSVRLLPLVFQHNGHLSDTVADKP